MGALFICAKTRPIANGIWERSTPASHAAPPKQCWLPARTTPQRTTETRKKYRTSPSFLRYARGFDGWEGTDELLPMVVDELEL
jgi:hypothetical protein